MLWLIYDDHVQLLQDILDTNNEKTMHQKNLENLPKEIYKFLQWFILTHNEQCFQSKRKHIKS